LFVTVEMRLHKPFAFKKVGVKTNFVDMAYGVGLLTAVEGFLTVPVTVGDRASTARL
jgi:hypothetical protein